MVIWAYSEIASEDSSGPITIGDVSLTVGAMLTGSWRERWNWKLRGEATDTFSNRFFGIAGVPEELSANRNFIFTDGYTYRDRFIGPSIGGDGRLITMEFSIVDPDSRLYFLRHRHVRINDSDRGPIPASLGRINFNNQVSNNRERFHLFEAGMQLPPSDWGRLGAELRVQTDEPNTPDRSRVTGSFEVNWTYRF